MQQAFLFPGQGSQFVGMGKALAERYAEAREVFAQVDDVLKFALSRLMFEGPMEDLTLTVNAQPALMAVSQALLAVLERQGGKKIDEMCQFVAGHSLGEYSALAATRALSLEDTARLLKIRGDAMQSAVPVGQGAMIALLGADMQETLAIAQAAGGIGACEIANDNAPGQVVLSGTVQGIDKAIAAAAELGKKAIKLPVSAPFHSTMMLPAARRMEEALAEVKIHMPVVPVITNMTATPCIDPDEIKRLLVAQVTGRVRWRETLLTIEALGMTRIVEVGAGKVLCGMVKRTTPVLQATSIQSVEDVEAFLVGA